MSSPQYVTKETFDKMRKDLLRLKSVERSKAANAIAEAREKGDLKENAEYDAAKNAQGMLEAKIKQLEGVLSYTRIVDESTIDTSKVSILTTVTISNIKTNQQLKYKIVSANEANVKENKLSVDSPIGKTILGKTKGDIVDITTPSGSLSFHIDDITL